MQYRLKISRDTDADSPRECPVGTMVCWHRRSNLGDEQVKMDDYESPYDCRKQAIPDGAHVLPLYLYEHGGMCMSTEPFQSAFDSGQVGWIYMTHADATDCWGSDYTAEQVLTCFKSEVAEYSEWLQGNCWGFELEKVKPCDSCGHIEFEPEESCWGFIGDETPDAIKDALSEEHHGLIEEAWENRS